ncbi:Uncharacterised protein r2_g2151 [Pycnogonum litorale]
MFEFESTSTVNATDSTTNGGDSAAVVSFVGGVAIKLPPFWSKVTDLWFTQVEAQFSLRNITVQQTKFNYIVAALSPEVIVEVRDIVLNPPKADPYDRLKAALISRTADSEQTRLQRLLDGEHLGDRAPSQLLQRMQQLLGDVTTMGRSILKGLFLRRLPTEVNMVLASAGDSLDINQLAAMADKIMEVSRPPVSTLSAVSQSAPSTSTNSVDALHAEVRQLRDMVQSLTL